MLLEKGGYWVDTDVVCLKPFRFNSDYIFARSQVINKFSDLIKKRYSVPNWFIKAPAGSEIMEYCYKEALEKDPEELTWGETGPRLLTKAVYTLGMQEHIAPHGTFHPNSARLWKHLIDGSLIATLRWRIARNRAYAVHLYNEIWRRKHIDKNATFPQNSVYEILKRRYLTFG